MSESEEIGDRVTRLEHEVARAREDAAAARVLAGGADRDVSAMQGQLRAHTRSLNALRETQLDHGRKFAKLDVRLSDLEGEMRNGFSTLAVGQAQITALLTDQLGESGEASSD